MSASAVEKLIAPAVMFIESAQDMLANREICFIQDELKEFDFMGAARLEAIRERLKVTDFEAGYLLGLETARAYLAGNPPAVQAGVKF